MIRSWWWGGGAVVMMATNTCVWAYPPAVGIVGKARNCLVCHTQNGPWKEDSHLVVDILDGETKQSLKQPDGTFMIEVERKKSKTVLTVLGRAKGDAAPSPTRNAWLYVAPARITEDGPSQKFAPGWDVNLSLSCRLVGDRLPDHEGAALTVAPMTLLPTDQAKDATLELQALLTRGDSVKGQPKEGLIATYLLRLVKLVVKEPAPEKPKHDDKK